MVAEGPLHPPLPRVHVAFQHDLGAGRHHDGDADALHHLHRLLAEEAGEDHLVQILRQRRGGRVDRRRVGADGHRHGQPLPPALRHPVVLGPALVGVPVHAGGLGVSKTCRRYMPTLRLPVSGWCVNTSGRVTKGPPSSGQQVSTGILVRSTSSSFKTISWQGAWVTSLGKMFPRRASLGSILSFFDEGVRGLGLQEAQDLGGDIPQAVHLQGQAHALHGPEGVHEHGHVVAGDVFEKEGRPVFFVHPVGDFGDLEVGAHRLLDAHQFPGLVQDLDKMLQALVSHINPDR